MQAQSHAKPLNQESLFNSLAPFLQNWQEKISYNSIKKKKIQLNISTGDNKQTKRKRIGRFGQNNLISMNFSTTFIEEIASNKNIKVNNPSS